MTDHDTKMDPDKGFVLAMAAGDPRGLSGLMDVASSIWQPVLKPMTVGAIPIGITAGVIAYVVTRWFAIAFQISRRKMLAEKARHLKEEAMAHIDTHESPRDSVRETTGV